MAKTFVAVVTDDLTGEVIKDGTSETIEFALEGKSYVIDLTAENAAALRESFAKYTAAATKVGGPTRTRTRSRAKDDLTAIRSWAAENGYTVASRGRVSAEVRKAYADAH